MPFSPATSRPMIDDMATTSLRVGRLARWRHSQSVEASLQINLID